MTTSAKPFTDGEIASLYNLSHYIDGLQITDAEWGRVLRVVEAHADWCRDHAQVMSETCPSDEKHCTCVLHLRFEVEQLKAERVALRGRAAQDRARRMAR